MKKLLIVVDYQKDFVDGALGFGDAVKLEQGICSRIEEYIKNNDNVVFTLDTHYENYLETVEGKNLPVSHCIKGTEGHKLYGKVSSLSEGCLKFEKTTFPSSDLLNYLINSEYEEIELCGVVTNICVISNAVIAKAAKPNARICVNRTLSASNDKHLEELSIEIMKNLHIEIIE